MTPERNVWDGEKRREVRRDEPTDRKRRDRSKRRLTTSKEKGARLDERFFLIDVHFFDKILL